MGKYIKKALCMEMGSFPIRNLGQPLVGTRISVVHCQPLLDRILGRLNSWIVRYLYRSVRTSKICDLCGTKLLGTYLPSFQVLFGEY